jgi:hypothetical protein
MVLWALPFPVRATIVGEIIVPPVDSFDLAPPDPSGARPLRWELSGVTFQDGGTASGYFVWDAGAPHGEQLGVTDNCDSFFPAC